MIGIRIPRVWLFVVALGAVAAVVMLFMVYGQNRWLADQIVTASSQQHYAVMQDSFERRARSEIQALAATLPVENAAGDAAALTLAMNQALGTSDNLAGIRFTSSTGEFWESGIVPAVDDLATTAWLPERLVIAYPVSRSENEIGYLSGSFDLAELSAEYAAFADRLSASEMQNRRVSYSWIAGGTLVLFLFSSAIVWLIVHGRLRRIVQLKRQAERFRDADFGDPLPETRGDDIDELAAVFNEMRDRLRSTTITRDYLDNILSGMNEAIIVTASDGKIERINTATTHLLGYDETELLGTSIDFVVDVGKSGSLADDLPSGLPKEATFESKFGELIPVSYTCSVIKDNHGAAMNRIYAAQNITERQRAEKRIRYLARMDALTKIPNRMQFQHLLQRGIARARRAGRPLCLFYVDIDHFKEINDTFGHLAGDMTLETVAQRLAADLPPNSIIGRLAGDEFAVMIDGLDPGSTGIEATRELAQLLLNRLAEPFFVHGHEVFMTASMGIAFYPKDAPNVIDLIRNADASLYHAKKSGGNQFAFYEPEMNEASVDRLMTKSKLKRSFERDELLVHYQPKYNLETGEVYGAEALVRWELPERGLILPADFIPIAEESSLIIEIGEWVLDKVCEDFRLWQRSVPSPGRVSVNLSLKQLRQLNFITRITSILRGHEVSPTSLELEITETTLMENPERTIKLLDQLYGLGLHLAIDDFGTGYSSLSALQQFPISTLKIDQSFVRNIATSPDDATIVDTIIKMGQNLNMDVVAEGVEVEAQLNFLQELGCTYVQGLLFGEPMSSENYLELLLAQADGTDSYRALFA
ncbi:MAG: EAL domain-containing protein [Gammaproteobacteria bacterium]|nr:EAL domain-containing protein [Gammaproteobacteria bacterium]MBU2678496.1 EAL domain-containing protein [Gammaproteobacteria bacterium]NNC56904.1 EAL domain-containing protein [Woeseiaceae bacterium]NNL52231.1 EAL domain-containing protein [Woeseiaceae bacterium]